MATYHCLRLVSGNFDDSADDRTSGRHLFHTNASDAELFTRSSVTSRSPDGQVNVMDKNRSTEVLTVPSFCLSFQMAGKRTRTVPDQKRRQPSPVADSGVLYSKSWGAANSIFSFSDEQL